MEDCSLVKNILLDCVCLVDRDFVHGGRCLGAKRTMESLTSSKTLGRI